MLSGGATAIRRAGGVQHIDTGVRGYKSQAKHDLAIVPMVSLPTLGPVAGPVPGKR